MVVTNRNSRTNEEPDWETDSDSGSDDDDGSAASSNSSSDDEDDEDDNTSSEEEDSSGDEDSSSDDDHEDDEDDSGSEDDSDSDEEEDSSDDDDEEDESSYTKDAQQNPRTIKRNSGIDGDNFTIDDDDDDDASSDESDASSDESDASSDESDDDDDSNSNSSNDDSDDDTDDDEDSSSDSSSYGDDSVFRNEETNDNVRSGGRMSSGSLMNEPGQKSNDDDDGSSASWMKCVPGCIIAMGTTAIAIFCCCLCFIPLLIIIIGLSVGLTSTNNDTTNGTDDLFNGNENIIDDINDNLINGIPVLDDIAPVRNETVDTPFPPTPEQRPLWVPVTTIPSTSDTTIYRNGLFKGSSYGDDTTMLVQNGPPGDPEIASAYSLVEFEGIEGIVDNNGTMSIDTYLTDNIDGLSFQFCLTRATAASSSEDDADAGTDASLPSTISTQYSTCLLPSSSSDGADNEMITTANIESWTGDTAPDYRIPASCYNGKVVTFDVLPSTTNICIDVTSLFFEEATSTGKLPPITRRRRQMETIALSTRKETTNHPNLRGRSRRSLDEALAGDSNENENRMNTAPMVFMIDTLQVSNKPGDRFYTSNDQDGREPTFQIAGENTCTTVVDVACNDPQFSTLCSLVNGLPPDLVNALNSQDLYPEKTVFAPTNEAFAKLPPNILANVMNDTDALIEVLLYHVVPSIVMSTDLVCGVEIEMVAESVPTTTLCGGGGSNGMFYQADSGITSGLPKIIAADIETCYGVIHVIDEVLIPVDPNDDNSTCSSNATQSIADIACTDPDFSLLCGLVRQAGMGTLLTGGNHTVFAPTNEAFTKVMASMGQAIDLTDQGLVTNVLLQHIVWGSVVYSSNLTCDMSVSMGNDENNTIACKDGSFFVGGPSNGTPDAFPQIISADIEACNGVIHVINGVILPGIDVTDNNNTAGNETAVYVPCGICGNGQMISVPDATIMIPESVGIFADQAGVTCEMAEGFCQSGACSPETCTAFSLGVSKPCGCTPGTEMGQDDLDTDAVFPQCNICGSTDFIVTNNDAMITVPDGVDLPGMEDVVRNMEVDCGFVEQKCQNGFCNKKACKGFSTDATKASCGCTLTSSSVGGGVSGDQDGIVPSDGSNNNSNNNGGNGGAAAMQQCSICGSLTVSNNDAMITIPDSVYLPGVENMEATCGFVEEQCQTGFCNPETCKKLDTDTTKEACGCTSGDIEI